MSHGRNPDEVAEAVAADATILLVAARELHVPAEYLGVVALAGDASSRQYFRVSGPDGPVIVARYPNPFNIGEGAIDRFRRWCRHPLAGRVTFANDPLCHVEMTSLFDRFGVPVPEILAIADREGVIIVDDAGDNLLQAWALTAPPELVDEAFDRAVDLIRLFRAASDAALQSGMVAGELAFDVDKLEWELDFWRTNCFSAYLGKPLDESLDAQVRVESRLLAGRLAERPRVLCHRDYHARNLIVRSGYDDADGLVVIDFQDARMGPVTYDMVSLVEDPYTELDERTRSRLVERFCDALRRDCAWPGDDVFTVEYDLMTVQRLLKAIGTYTHQAAVRRKLDYMPYIRPAAETVVRALARLGEFPALREAASRPPRTGIAKTHTMNQTYIKDIAAHAGEEVTIKGWLYNLRSSGKICFPQVRDGSGNIQCVAVKSALPEESVRIAQAPDPGIVPDRPRQDSRRSPRARRLRDGRGRRRHSSSAYRIRSVSHHSQRSTVSIS